MGDTGVSSKAMACRDYPGDLGDFERCLDFLDGAGRAAIRPCKLQPART